LPVCAQDKKGGKLDFAIVEATEILADGSIMCASRSSRAFCCAMADTGALPSS
jgi:hypothetical protein